MRSLLRLADSRAYWYAAAAIAIFLYFFGLTIPLIGPDEPRYAQVAREMFLRSDWVTPTLGGAHWFEKPALLYWLQIASYNIFGVTEFAARFGSALFGLGTVASLYIFGRAVRVEPRGHDTFARWLALVAASTLGIIVFSRGASFDIILTFPITASLVAYFVADRSSTTRSKIAALAVFYFFVGVATLAKGLVGIVFPAAIVTFFHLLDRRWPSREALRSMIWGPFITVATASLWYLPMYLRHGYEFIDEFFIQHHFQRYTSNKYLHPQPFHFFFWVLPLMTIPWLPFFFTAVYRGVRNVVSGLSDRISSTQTDDGFTTARTFAASWLLVPLVFFSFSGSKLPGYILPAIPAAIILTAPVVWRLTTSGDRWRLGLKALPIATFLVIILIIQFALPRFAQDDSVAGLIRAANEAGYESNKVITFVNVSHNAEFYASGRLFRTEDGKQDKLRGPGDVVPYIEKAGGPLVVLVPQEHLRHMTDKRQFTFDILAENSETVVGVARLR